MNPTFIYSFTACALFIIGFYALLVHSNLVRKILAINIMNIGVGLLIVSLGWSPSERLPSDPISHSLVLTGLVISVASTALFLAIYIRLHERSGQSSLDDEPPQHKRQ